MLLVYTKVDRSPVHGVGLFAAQDIPKGTKVWEFNPLVDVTIAPEDLDKLSAPSRETIERLAYFCDERNAYIVSADGAHYMNHSDDPSVRDDVAVRDIAAGEELTEDYGHEYGETP